MDGQHQGGHERMQDDRGHGTELKCVAHEDKGRLITTWKRHVAAVYVRRLTTYLVQLPE